MNEPCEAILVEMALDEIKVEYRRAVNLHAPMHSAHEGYAVILEEVDELKAEVWKKKQSRETVRREAIHVAAMALRLIVDVCERAAEGGGDE